jgi:hypothetical protein
VRELTVKRYAMRAIQKFLPNPRHTEVHRIFVNAKPEVAWQAARHFDMSEIGWIKLLFDIRTFPDALSGKRDQRVKPGLGIDEITKSDTGFIILDEIPGREVVIGSVGKFWHLKIPFQHLAAQEFEVFDKPGFGKIAWGIAVDPFLSGSTIAIELRTSATDHRSWKRLRRYYRIIGIGSKLIRSSVIANLEAQLGKMKLTDDFRRLPGDQFIPEAKHQLTFHRNIEAPVSIVWRYIMQLGCDRAGWYSLDWLDHASVPSTDHLVAGWESRAVGDKVSATPEGDEFFNAYSVEFEKHFVIGGETKRAGGPFKMTWAFIVEPIGQDATRLITRARMMSSPKWAEYAMGKILYPPIHGLMSRAQLGTIKELAERDAQSRMPDPVILSRG